MRSSVSILGLYNYDNTLFANMAYPTGFTADDKATLTNNLLMELAELEVVYPDVGFMKSAIGFWSAKEVVTWNRVYAAAQEEYNPIENYDRQESSTDVTDGTRQHSGTDTSTTTVDNDVVHSGTDTSTTTIDNDVVHSGSDVTANSGTDTTTNSGTDTTTNKIASYDSSVLQTHDTSDLLHGHIAATQHGMSSTISHGEHIATDETVSGSMTHGEHIGTDETVSGSMTHGEKIDDDITLTHTSRIHGNIGVTTSQQMLEQELLVAPKLNIINYIIESFKNRFCLMVY